MRELAETILFGLTGAVVGSFLNVVIWRLPRGESLVHPRSRCPRCGALIRWFDNVPVLSWLLLRARCRSCRAPISARYPMVEALTALLFVLAHRSWPDDPATAIVLCAFLAALVAISFIDIDHRIIPDRITKPGMVVAVALAPLVGLHPRDWIAGLTPGLNVYLHAAAGLLVGGAAILGVRILGRLAFKKEAMGLGDAKLLALVGAMAGPLGALYALFVACLVGAVIGIGLYLFARFRPLRCSGSIEGGGVRQEVTGVRFRQSDLVATMPKPAEPGTKVSLRLVLPAVRILEDVDAEVRLAGRIVSVEPAGAGSAWRIALEPPSPQDHERVETFAASARYVPFGPFLAVGGVVVALYGAEIHDLITRKYPNWVMGR